MFQHALVALGLSASLAAASDDPPSRIWGFDDSATFRQEFEPAVGDWAVVPSQDGKGSALEQTAKNERPVFNVLLVKGPAAQDLDLSVRLQSIAGEIDQGGGLVWRAKDARNYYIARYNPLEDNLRLYHVVEGKRTQLDNVDIPRSPGWHTLRVRMSGDRIQVFYDDEQRIERRDSTFSAPGRFGLWTKADARTQFDDLTLGTAAAEEVRP
jgi:hypothetical protein